MTRILIPSARADLERAARGHTSARQRTNIIADIAIRNSESIPGNNTLNLANTRLTSMAYQLMGDR